MDGQSPNEQTARVIVVNAKMLTNLYGTTEIKSVDYNSVKALAQVRSTRSSVQVRALRARERTGPPLRARRGLVAQRCVALGIARRSTPRSTSARTRTTPGRSSRDMSIGATRLEDEGVVEIACANPRSEHAELLPDTPVGHQQPGQVVWRRATRVRSDKLERPPALHGSAVRRGRRHVAGRGPDLLGQARRCARAPGPPVAPDLGTRAPRRARSRYDNEHRALPAATSVTAAGNATPTASDNTRTGSATTVAGRT